MAELKCPHCGTVFTVDDNEFASIVKQIRDGEFQHDVEERVSEKVDQLTEKHKLELQAKESVLKQQLQDAYAKELQKLKDELNNLKSDNQKLQAEVEAATDKQELAVQNAIQEFKTKNQELESKLREEDTAHELALQKAVKAIEDEKQELILKLATEESQHKLEVAEAVSKVEAEKKELEQKLTAEKEKHESVIAQKDEVINYYKDLKTKMSTKMVGETLEQHCEIQFNQLRATAFPSAYFEKDNDARSGSKGDFIYRENDEFGNEIVSIMFEMKNEMDETSTKHKNEDFFKELDKDRKEKNCEYAVLVSLLETDSELYNAGIVDVSYKYKKMYVVRPQCFIPIITLLRDAAKNALSYKQELAVVKSQNVDITNFEENLRDFKDAFSKNYIQAHTHFDKAIEEIDKTIDHLQKVKKELQGSDNQLRLANNKVDEVSVKKLTKNNPTMQAEFERVRKAKAEQ